ncbi:MAG: hypothetical protein RQ760_14900, partial [Sedimentisphaerales bacterium]|nr:hypothetical protein [Sedimentisphaerales bacterium]
GIRQPRKRISTKDYVRIYKPFYAKQTQFSGLQNDANSVYTKDYEEYRRKVVMKKQSQFNPKQTQFKPNFTPFKGAVSDAFGSNTIISYILSNELWRFLSTISKLGGES